MRRINDGFMDVGDKLCWRQLGDVDDNLQGSLNINVGHQHSKDVINIEIPSSISTCHQHLCSQQRPYIT